MATERHKSFLSCFVLMCLFVAIAITCLREGIFRELFAPLRSCGT